jgi:hypothetical protein
MLESSALDAVAAVLEGSPVEGLFHDFQWLPVEGDRRAVERDGAVHVRARLARVHPVAGRLVQWEREESFVLCSSEQIARVGPWWELQARVLGELFASPIGHREGGGALLPTDVLLLEAIGFARPATRQVMRSRLLRRGPASWHAPVLLDYAHAATESFAAVFPLQVGDATWTVDEREGGPLFVADAGVCLALGGLPEGVLLCPHDASPALLVALVSEGLLAELVRAWSSTLEDLPRHVESDVKPGHLFDPSLLQVLCSAEPAVFLEILASPSRLGALASGAWEDRFAPPATLALRAVDALLARSFPARCSVASLSIEGACWQEDDKVWTHARLDLHDPDDGEAALTLRGTKRQRVPLFEAEALHDGPRLAGYLRALGASLPERMLLSEVDALLPHDLLADRPLRPSNAGCAGDFLRAMLAPA